MATCCDISETLDCLREAVTCSLRDTATFLGRTLTPNGRGGNTEVWASIGTSACRVQRLKEPVEVVKAEKVTVVAGYKVWLPTSVTLSLTGEKRVTIGGVTYEIVHMDAVTTDRVFNTLFCNLVT